MKIYVIRAFSFFMSILIASVIFSFSGDTAQESSGLSSNISEKILSVKWMDNDEEVAFEQEGDKVTIHTVPFRYGRSLVVRVAKMICE